MIDEHETMYHSMADARTEIRALRTAFMAAAPAAYAHFCKCRPRVTAADVMWVGEAALQRRAAKLAGHKKYLGRECQYGHRGIRYTTTTACVECATEGRYKAEAA